ncbi:hypothetical protein IV78_GL000374 [Pediococcus acidilactici]|uniref:Uncharacterized protein n=1 Tax=Pediococcus acidilactici DSM 20284 TaxID=862514 RepID=E0NDR3_PEDAC|nr:hypothetical protein HMPREF0623_0435 [Pediococcus acidilactici DSM 20284]KRN17286.1 hypothetical protein IV78_GL000374 [Pediococcus acidilactici]
MIFLNACQEIQNTFVFESPFEVGVDGSKIYTEKYDYLKNIYKELENMWDLSVII